MDYFGQRDVSLLPARFSVDGNTTAGTSLRNCQGGKLKTRGTRYTDLQVRDVEGEEVLLRHEFIVGDVTTGLVSLGQLYQAGWKIDGEGSNELFLIDPQDQIKVPVYFTNKSFAIRACVRHVEEREDDDDSDVSSFHVRTIVQVFEEMELCDFNTWQMTESGTPYIKNVGNSYLDPRPTWGHYWPFRTTLVRRTNTTDSWTLVEMTQRFMDKDEPFGLIDECIFNMDGECEILTILGVEEHGFEEFGDLLDEDEEVDGPLRLPDSQPQEQQPAVPVEQHQDVSQGAVSSEAIQVREPPGLSLQDPLGGEEPAAALADVAFPEIESVELDDGLILTCESSVRDLRAGCRLLGISQAGSKGKMFERLKKSYVQGMRRAAIDMARAEYQQEEHPAQPAHLAARQPTQRERSLHELTHLPYRDWCPFCVSTRARGDHHASHADPDLAAEGDRPTIQVDFYFRENRDKSEGSLGSSRFCLWWIHGQDMHMQNLSNPRTPRWLEVQFQNLLEVWVMLVRLKFVETMRMFWSVAWNFSSRLELVKALARRSRPIATTERIALAFVNEQFRLSAICRRHW